MGSEGDITPYLLSRYLGLKHLSTLYAFTWTMYAIGAAAGPILVGNPLIRSDRTGRPQFSCWLCLRSFLVCSCSCCLNMAIKSFRARLPAPTLRSKFR